MQCKAVGIIGQFMVCAMLQSEGQSYFISAAAVLLFIVKSNEWWPLRSSDQTQQRWTAAGCLYLCSTDRNSAGWAGSQQLIENWQTPVATADWSNMDPVGPYWSPDPWRLWQANVFWAGKRRKHHNQQEKTNKGRDGKNKVEETWAELSNWIIFLNRLDAWNNSMLQQLLHPQKVT